MITLWDWVLLLGGVFAAGACIGSFVNVCVCRIQAEESVVFPGSHCRACGKPIAWYDNIPVLSWFVLRGQCRHCKASFSPRYWIVEFLMGIYFVLLFMEYGFQFLLPVYWVVAAGLVVAALVDLDAMIIPDSVSIGGIVVGLILSYFMPQLHGTTDAWQAVRFSLAGIVLGAGMLWSVGWIGTRILKKDAMGLGDVKLMGAIGAFFGWQGVLFAVLVSSLIGTMAGLLMIAMKKYKMRSQIPYGPYISLAVLIWMVWGHHWWDAYMRWISPSY